MGRLTERDKHEQGIWVDVEGMEDIDRWVEPFETIYPAINKLAHYEDLEEQGLLTIIDNETFQRDDLDRCTHRHCNKCDKYRRELQQYKDLEEQGRLIEVVRCKECWHYDTGAGYDGWGLCELYDQDRKDNDYCSFGELKELEGDKE